MESDVSGSKKGATNPRTARPWPNHARNLADDLQTVLDGIGENSMNVTALANDIDTIVLDAINDIRNGDEQQAIVRLQTIISKTTVQRRRESDSLVATATAAKRLAWALVGKYD